MVSRVAVVKTIRGVPEAFQEALNLILQLLLNSVRVNVYLSSSTTIDPNNNNNAFSLYVEPRIV